MWNQTLLWQNNRILQESTLDWSLAILCEVIVRYRKCLIGNVNMLKNMSKKKKKIMDMYKCKYKNVCIALTNTNNQNIRRDNFCTFKHNLLHLEEERAMKQEGQSVYIFPNQSFTVSLLMLKSEFDVIEQISIRFTLPSTPLTSVTLSFM